QGGASLASALGTKGLIFRDEGRDAEAVDWLRKAYEEHQKLASPNLDAVIEDLESEAAALKRLGRTGQAEKVEQQLGDARTLLKNVPRTEQDLSPLASASQAAVLVELNCATGMVDRSLNRECIRLGKSLGAIVEEQGGGWYAGSVSIPESTTLFFYGKDAESLLAVLEPRLRAEPLCKGARVIIRQTEN